MLQHIKRWLGIKPEARSARDARYQATIERHRELDRKARAAIATADKANPAPPVKVNAVRDSQGVPRIDLRNPAIYVEAAPQRSREITRGREVTNPILDPAYAAVMASTPTPSSSSGCAGSSTSSDSCPSDSGSSSSCD